MFSCNLHEFSGFGDACPKCLKELAERHASKTESEFPTTPAAPEWDGEGLPPVGCECEYRPDPKIHDGWHHCVYLAHYDREHFVLVSETGEVDRMLDTLSPSFRFRPIPTKAQRDRDDLAETIATACTLKADIVLSDWQYDHIADAIIAAGWTKEPKP